MCEETGATWLPGPLHLLPLHRPAALVRVQGWLAETQGQAQKEVSASLNKLWLREGASGEGVV